jgi:hypothetical protein
LLGLGWLRAARAARPSGRVVSGTITVAARPLDENRSFEIVMFYLDDECIYSTNVAPYRCDLDTRQFPNGRHLLRALAYHRTVRVGASPPVPIRIDNSPGNPAATEGGATIELAFSTAEQTRQEFLASAAGPAGRDRDAIPAADDRDGEAGAGAARGRADAGPHRSGGHASPRRAHRLARRAPCAGERAGGCPA